MNNVIAFFVGSLTFVIIMIIKIPVKKLTSFMADKLSEDEADRVILNKRLNGIIFVLAFTIAVICYYFVLQWLGSDHYKWCCSLKAGTIAIALYALFEQWFGEDSIKGDPIKG
ncbi:MAG TPA: hypothetical protein VJY54_13755, partial [Lachnospiraceae bacterium]|nr:hypothetical protein [Lachnospiraceae bacterium]